MVYTKSISVLKWVTRREVFNHMIGLATIGTLRVTPVCQKVTLSASYSTTTSQSTKKLALAANQARKLTLINKHEPTLNSDLTINTEVPFLTLGHGEAQNDAVTLGTEGRSTEKSPAEENEFGVDLLAEMDDPPVLHEYASLPLPSHSYTLASYVEHSETLQKLVQLGVDLSKVEKRQRVPSELLKMDFERDIKDKLVYLTQVGVEGKDLGNFITKNPHILLETVDELEDRVSYLKSKKFTDSAISKIVNKAPYFLSFSVLRVDRKLGYLQQLLQLKGAEVRDVITKEPKLVTYKVSRIQENVFILRQQLGFQRSELKSLIVREPKLLLRGKYRLIGTFDYIHNVMEIPHKVMLGLPKVLHGRVHKLQERHQYLKSLKRDIYDPTKPQYVPLDRLLYLPDSAFCEEIAKKPLEQYNIFLKSL